MYGRQQRMRGPRCAYGKEMAVLASSDIFMDSRFRGNDGVVADRARGYGPIVPSNR